MTKLPALKTRLLQSPAVRAAYAEADAEYAAIEAKIRANRALEPESGSCRGKDQA